MNTAPSLMGLAADGLGEGDAECARRDQAALSFAVFRSLSRITYVGILNALKMYAGLSNTFFPPTDIDAATALWLD
jgi:hypothetical protein